MDRKIKVNGSVKYWYYNTRKKYMFYFNMIYEKNPLVTEEEKENAKIEVIKYQYALEILEEILSPRQREEKGFNGSIDGRLEYLEWLENKQKNRGDKND